MADTETTTVHTAEVVRYDDPVIITATRSLRRNQRRTYRPEREPNFHGQISQDRTLGSCPVEDR